MLSRNKKNSLNILIIFIIMALTPSTMYSQNSGNESSGVPTWAKVTFWGAFGVVLGKVFIYDRYFDSSEDENKNRFSLKDSTFNSITYLLDDHQQNQYDTLDSEQEKSDFLNEFWDKLENQYTKDDLRQEFESRYTFADSAYRLPYKKGWKTDRGRIHILYGTPHEKLLQPFGLNPFLTINSTKFTDLEIWYYNSAKGQNEIPINLRSYNTGQMFFVFCRRYGHAEYEQVFSSELGEKIDAGLYGAFRISD